jgi:hypothetical protein
MTAATLLFNNELKQGVARATDRTFVGALLAGVTPTASAGATAANISADLATLHAHYPEFSDESAELCAAWPIAIAGTHRLHFDDGRITLTLVFAGTLARSRWR